MKRSEKLAAQLPPEPAGGSLVIGEKTGLAYQCTGGRWRGLSETGPRSYSWIGLLAAEETVTLVWDWPDPDSARDPGPSAEIIAAAESERETWQLARAQLAGALGADLHETWPNLLDRVCEAAKPDVDAETRAAIREDAERETWRIARAQLGHAAGVDPGAEWSLLLEIVRNDREALKGPVQ